MAHVLSAVGDRWGAILMRDLLLGSRAMTICARSTGITNNTLADRLKALEGSGLIEKRQYPARPDRCEYLPTEKGKDLGLLVMAMIQIGDKWNLSELAGPPLRVVDRATGHPATLPVVDAVTGESLPPQSLALAAGPGADEIPRWRLAVVQAR
ncbi:TPA: winged helix-turn-helix transcriptional regulator [Serratia marcescens]|uniref:winged helix-turn-helix transcriptional regulator n=1 Tax=Serratia marcescens TaxID=615 RepID=UPI001FCA805A|nr:helix-turn-helix domain-containing protein [Serratia marcescens]